MGQGTDHSLGQSVHSSIAYAGLGMGQQLHDVAQEYGP